MATNSQSFAALKKIKDAGIITGFIAYLESCINPPATEADSISSTRAERLIFDGVGLFKKVPDNSITSIEDYNLTGLDFLVLDEADKFAVDIWNKTLVSWNKFATVISYSDQDIEDYKVTAGLAPSTTFAQTRLHFYNEDFRLFYFPVYKAFLAGIKTRIELYNKSPNDGIDFPGEEERDGSENGIIDGVNQLEDIWAFSANGNVTYAQYIYKLFSKRNVNYYAQDSFKYTNSFDRAFSNINLDGINSLSENRSNVAITSIFSKLEDSGLLELASYAYEIGEFAKKRFRNKEQLQKGITDPDSEGGSVVNQQKDLPWIILLGEVIQKLRFDPISFASIVYYFPSLTTFLLDAIAAVGDYTNQGKGGDDSDPDAFINTLEKAFGVNSNGEAVFKMAFRSMTTSQRINKVLSESPFRKNIAPQNPDIFHLRLGASNFYVPPISIDVNSSFKTGSLTGGAIRQKNSPKFNSGYKETSVRLRLFFPNYEEIWGISIDDASEININEAFELDFKNNGASEIKIDKFLSSLRGLVAAFKYSPILPVKNQYLNTVHGITGVALSSMSVSTIPNFPFALAVDIELLNFNHAPFLPMLKDFNQAVHWGKYRQYMGKAAGSLHRYVNEQFLIKTSSSKDSNVDVLENSLSQTTGDTESYSDSGTAIEENNSTLANSIYQNDVLKFNIGQEWEDGNHIVLYAPAESQTKIFLPDTASFRSEQEKIYTDVGRSVWDGALAWLGIDPVVDLDYSVDFAEAVELSRSGAYSKSSKNIILDVINLMVAGVNTDNDTEKIYLYLVESFIQQNTNKLTKDEKNWLKDYDSDITSYPAKNTYIFQSLFLSGEDSKGISLNSIKATFKSISRNPKNYLDFIVDEKYNDITYRTGAAPDRSVVKDDVKRAFVATLYERVFKSGPIQSLMEAAREKEGAFQFNEWEVPMIKVEFDRSSVIVNGLSVSLGNNFAKMQIQMQDEPSYQHIGGRDSYINVSMTIIGEKELIKFKNLFDHISGLARLEHATGVIGFLGIKNVVTALCGIKYVLPLNYRVNTVPNYPHVYSVELSLVDFDIFQQKREQLSSAMQKALVEEFSTKRNPFLRMKQLWDTFNAYPDFPLQVRDSSGNTVGHLDPDFYFRSFEMFDRDVINSVTTQTPKVQDFIFDDPLDVGDIGLVAEVSNKILEFLRLYSQLGLRDSGPAGSGNITLQQLIQSMVDYLNQNRIDQNRFISIFSSLVSTPTDGYSTSLKSKLLTNFIELAVTDEDNPYLLNPPSAPFRQGDISPNSYELLSAVNAMLAGEYSPPSEEFVSFDPDEVDFHKIIHAYPAADDDDLGKGNIPATCITAIGTYFGYINKENGRFYLTNNGTNVKKDPNSGSKSLTSNLMVDTQIPEYGNTVANTGVPGVKALSEYQNAYDGGIYSHLEKMMVDANYRDISGRMLRAFPTYMLWLIDEGGYFAGVKLFDNFYGLQSVIDFSVVSSEDLLGDTLILRVSNMYSKLTTKESSSIFNPNFEQSNPDELSLSDGLTNIIDRTLNISRNIMSHMRNEYIVDIANIRLKPGVRVHLRAGYGSNPNSLQTLFNGIITNVEQGEIVTITAQSDAIELGAIVNSTDKKGDSGKIDGGIDTGLWLSEPRDLMVRLLSMGASRTREAISRATRGTVFSENRFGIRHFGSMLYEPLNKEEQEKNSAIRQNIASAFEAVGGNSGFGSKVLDVTSGFSMNTRGNTLSAIGQLWSNFSAEVDLELFKRNIYPGNGTGIAQFLGGDIDDGWLTAASLTEKDSYNERMEGHLSRLTDVSWNKVLENYDNEVPGASEAIDNLTSGNALVSSNRGGLVKGAFGAAAVGLGIVTGGGFGLAFAGAGLLGILSGRGGTNIFKTMGIIAPNSDDDLPGFDEVSFRAQTYMRTVWDLFQTCARLLPNYIVAVRPFEDRSTVFYGKPHWLYTSGVIPVTTGFPGEDKQNELGVKAPAIRDPDMDLLSILDRLNKDSNPLSDYAAYFQAFEPNETFQTLSQDMTSSNGIYAPTSRLNGKIMNFFSQPAISYKDNNSKVVAKIPKSKATLGLGFHLPVVDNGKVFDTVANQLAIPHKQISSLPPRFGFPFFSITEDVIIQNSNEVEEFVAGNSEADNNYNQLLELEKTYFKENNLSLKIDNELILDTPLNLKPLDTGQFALPSIVRMPYPNVGDIYSELNSGEVPIVQSEQVSDDFGFEYQSSVYGKLTYTEWGAPTSVQDEQFYIAMKWPYTPPNKDVVDLFKNEYQFEELYGSAADYKSRKVLIYNPVNQRAVVCRPAYFLWGNSKIKNGPGYGGVGNEIEIDGRVSPDAAYYLGIITQTESDDPLDVGDVSAVATEFDYGFRRIPKLQECYVGFVPDYVPVGVVATAVAPISNFKLSSATGEAVDRDEQYLIGFGKLDTTSDSSGLAYEVASGSSYERDSRINNSLGMYTPYDSKFVDTSETVKFGGNPLDNGLGKTYFEAVISGQEEDISSLSRLSLYNVLLGEKEVSNDPLMRTAFVPVWSPTDLIGVQARSFYEEAYDPSVSVIAGDGRSRYDADNIWNEFRFLYHTYDSVKKVFVDIYGLDPDSEEIFPPYIEAIINGKSTRDTLLDKFGDSGETALDEFAILLGSDYIDNIPTSRRDGSGSQEFKEAIEFARRNYIDAPASQGGLIEYFNNLISVQLKKVYENFLKFEILTEVAGTVNASPFDNLNQDTDETVSTQSSGTQTVDKESYSTMIKSPRQLFLLLVGIFRQRLWEDPYARAWLVLKADRKRGFIGLGGGGEEDGVWSFKSVDKVFREFINPYNDYGKSSKKQKFLQLLMATKGEGNSSTDIIIDAIDGVGNFFESNIAPIFNAISNGLSGLLNMFKLNMQQMGYALSEVGNFSRQANILNKALNDSIYYSLGRPGSLLRAVDNPFTREYGEPVIEIRESFQRVHYISSFSHILSNQIQENINNVTTVVTAISDGKYPVTVALDKGAPAERQVEKTVETGIYWDNLVGSGFTGFLHPFFHPLETARGVAKNIQGAPDELSARRVALAHLKESIKDIYGGELMVVGNPDIRPHDIVYIADVYERMYGIFEVEQVVHHFTPELGFVTAITPNAFVTVNDPSRWFISSWLDSWFNVQAIRNDTRMYLDSIRSANSGINIGGTISMDALGEALNPQMMGGIQYTHGSSALVKDLIANQMAVSLPGSRDQIVAEASAQGQGISAFQAISGALVSVVPVVGQLAWKGWKWVRDNLLDQHGAYVQYLNKNGQPMDAGLSYNQGMVVGKPHSKALLPGILGVRTKVRSAEGNTYIRSDDLFKSLGWQEKEIKDLVRYVSYENALVHARVLKLAGLGPEKASLQSHFRVVCKLSRVLDGDTIEVQDCLTESNKFTIRFDGINTAELNAIEQNIDFPDTDDLYDVTGKIKLYDISTPAGRAKVYTREALKDKLFVVRVAPSPAGTTAVLDTDYEPGASPNMKTSYQVDNFDRTIGTIFYYLPPDIISKIKDETAQIFRSKMSKKSFDDEFGFNTTPYTIINYISIDEAKEFVKATLYDKSPFFIKFETIYNHINDTVVYEFFDYSNPGDIMSTLPEAHRKVFNNLVYLKMLERIYEKASEWPMVSWDEYWENGYPVTLNWELVVNNLAQVYVKNLMTDSESVQDANELAAIPYSLGS
jgi:hypothetical protein